MPRFPTLQKDIRTDVLVIGGGMAGVLCARFLKSAGVDCVLVESDRIGSGVTAGTTAKITAQHGLIYDKFLSRLGSEKAQIYLSANLRAIEEYRQLAKAIDCNFDEQDHFVYSCRDEAVLAREWDALEKLGYSAKWVKALPIPLDTVGAIGFPRQARFHPLKFLAGLCKDLTIYERTPVRTLSSGTAVTAGGTIHAKAIVVATHFPFLNRHGSYFLKQYQQRSYVLALSGVPEFPGMYLDAQENGLSFRFYQDTLLLGGGGHRTGKAGGGWRALEDFTRKAYPNADIVCRWAAQDCMSLDGIPYVGRYGGLAKGLYVATGFNKWGMTSSMVAARLLTDLILERDNPCASLFSPQRSILRPQLAKNAWEAVCNLLTPSRKRCPHMGCTLKWNPQEQSWDCPCHGSRFDAHGTLLDGPATGDLPDRDRKG